MADRIRQQEPGVATEGIDGAEGHSADDPYGCDTCVDFYEEMVATMPSSFEVADTVAFYGHVVAEIAKRKSPIHVLDLFTGTGRVLLGLADLINTHPLMDAAAVRLTGVDASAAMLRRAANYTTLRNRQPTGIRWYRSTLPQLHMTASTEHVGPAATQLSSAARGGGGSGTTTSGSPRTSAQAGSDQLPTQRCVVGNGADAQGRGPLDLVCDHGGGGGRTTLTSSGSPGAQARIDQLTTVEDEVDAQGRGFFDLVIVSGSSFDHLLTRDAQAATLGIVRDSLADGGLAVVDLNNAADVYGDVTEEEGALAEMHTASFVNRHMRRRVVQCSDGGTVLKDTFHLYRHQHLDAPVQYLTTDCACCECSTRSVPPSLATPDVHCPHAISPTWTDSVGNESWLSQASNSVQPSVPTPDAECHQSLSSTTIESGTKSEQQAPSRPVCSVSTPEAQSQQGRASVNARSDQHARGDAVGEPHLQTWAVRLVTFAEFRTLVQSVGLSILHECASFCERPFEERGAAGAVPTTVPGDGKRVFILAKSASWVPCGTVVSS